jgi:hypothetical protein
MSSAAIVSRRMRLSAKAKVNIVGDLTSDQTEEGVWDGINQTS